MAKSRVVVPKLEFDVACNEIVEFIKKVVDDSKCVGVVLGLSGGVDSSLVAALCVKALGSQRVLGVLMPADFTPRKDMEDALELARWLKIQTKTVNVQAISDVFSEALGNDQGEPERRIPMANVLARIRMIILYYYANLKNYLVVGTGDRSESLIGYFTKYGDGGADLMPICHLYKTQVRELAVHLGVPQSIAFKPSSPQLYPGHEATDEIPINYERLDPVLVGLFDLNLPPEEVSSLTKVQVDIVKEVQQRFIRTMHKRAYPPKIRG